MASCHHFSKKFEEAEKMYLEQLHFFELHGFSQEEISAGIVRACFISVFTCRGICCVWATVVYANVHFPSPCHAPHTFYMQNIAIGFPPFFPFLFVAHVTTSYLCILQLLTIWHWRIKSGATFLSRWRITKRLWVWREGSRMLTRWNSLSVRSVKCDGCCVCCLLPSYSFSSAALSNLAYCYRQSGQLDRALSLYEEVLTICKRHLPPSHPSLADGNKRYAKSYRNNSLENSVCYENALSDMKCLVLQRWDICLTATLPNCDWKKPDLWQWMLCVWPLQRYLMVTPT